MTDIQWLKVVKAVDSIESMIKHLKSKYYLQSYKDGLHDKIINRLILVHEIVNSRVYD